MSSPVRLTGGAYTAHNVIASAQRSLNLYSEPMPQGEGEPAPAANYPTPGLRLLGTVGTGPIRAIRQATPVNAFAYVVSGSTVYEVNTETWVGTSLGDITAGLRTPVSISDNGTSLLIVDGSTNGWSVTAGVMAPIVDPTGMFVGADRVDYLDTFFLLNKPGTPQFYISGSLALTFDRDDFGNIEAASNLLVTLIVARREVYLLGTLTTEIWYDVGATGPTDFSTFQFAPVQGVFVDHGCVAKYSAASYDNTVFWLSRNRQGRGVVMTSAGYQTKRVSTYAIEAAIQLYARIDDAIGFCYQIAGHTFYVLTFPHADHTWCYDVGTGEWHEWAWIDSNGDEHRHRANAFWPVNDLLVVGDWQNGNLYALEQTAFTDNGNPIKRVRTYPHLITDARRTFYREFIADMDVGNAPQMAVEEIIPPTLSGFYMLPFLAPGGDALGYGISADGTTTVGIIRGTEAAPHVQQGCYWIGLTGPFLIEGTEDGNAWDVSGDGSIIVGNLLDGVGFYWTAAGGLVTFAGYATAISADGSIIVGNVPSPGPDVTPQPVYWDRATLTMTPLTLPAGYIGGQCYSISDNGIYIVGECFPSPGVRHAFRWTAAGGMVDLGILPGWTSSSGNGVSDDGTVVGYFPTSDGTGPFETLFVWTPAGGMTTPIPQDQLYGANAISGDGSTIYGYAWWPDIDHFENDHMGYAVSGVVVTPTPTLHPGHETFAGYDINNNAISHDGKVMVGYSSGAFIYHVPTPSRITIPVASNNLISLRWSDDRGHSYGSLVSQPIGAAGEYRKNLQWQRLGMARDRVFEISWSTPMATALQGAWLTAEVADADTPPKEQGE